MICDDCYESPEECKCGQSIIWNWLRRLFGKKSKKSNPPTGIIYVECPKNMKKPLYYHHQQGGEKTMAKETVLKARVAEVVRRKITFEFGATQANLDISGTGLAARKLKLKKGDQVSVTIKKLGK